MRFLLLLTDGDGATRTAELQIRELQEFSGPDGISTHFRPIRNDALFESAKRAGLLASRILRGEGMVRGHLAVEYQVQGTALNVTGRSAELLIALALLVSRWRFAATPWFQAIAATGAVDVEGATAAGDDASAAVQRVQHTVSKVAAAVEAFRQIPSAVVFYPAAEAAGVTAWSEGARVPPHVHLHPIAALEDALTVLGITLEKIYLGNPFRGFEPFEYAHRSIFFGRDEEVAALCEQLLRREAAGTPGVLVEGGSGCGKSSFLRAGVLPALIHPDMKPGASADRLRARPVPEGASRAIWRTGLLPVNAPEHKIAASVLSCWQCYPDLRTEGEVSLETLEALVGWWRGRWPAHRRFVWILDQFEEIFDHAQGVATIERLGEFLCELQELGAWTLVSIRADALPLFKAHAALRQVFGSNEGHYYLETVKAEVLEDVIVRPATAAALRFGQTPSGKSLDHVLRYEAHREAGNALPLLQFTLAELYQRRTDRVLTYEAYTALQGSLGIVGTLATSVLESIPEDSRVAPSRLFRALVTLDEHGRAIRRYAALTETRDDDALTHALAAFVRARLCVSDKRDGEGVVSFAHDALLRTWPALVDWLKDEAGLLQTRDLAQREMQLWWKHGKSDAWLAPADKLAVFEGLETAGVTVAGPVRDFIDRSRRRVRRTTRLRRSAVAMMAALAIVASVAGWVASRKQREAEYETARALDAQSRLLTETAAQRLRDFDLADAQGIILEVLSDAPFARSHTPEAVSVFQEIRAADAAIAVLAGHGDFLRSAVYSPDGTRIVTAALDKTARIWDARTGAQLAVLSGHGDRVNSAVFSPDGGRILTASADKTARIWDARTGAQLLVISGDVDRMISAAYSPDGTRIVTTSYGKTAVIWDARTGARLAALSGHAATVVYAAYSPDGTRIVTASADKTARIWDAETGKQLAVLSGHGATVESAAYSPDGTRIVTASYDKTARIWDAYTASQLVVLSGHGATVYSASYSHDGTHIVTASADKTARLWDTRSGAQVAVLSGHGDRVASAAYSPDGTRIVTASVDQTARIWDVRAGMPLAVLSGHGDRVNRAVYSPDGSRIVTASFDQTARIWDADAGTVLAVLAGHGDRVISVAYSHDGTHVVTASDDKTARIWDARTGTQLTVLSGHAATVGFAEYSPDGDYVVTASFDRTARIWDAHTGTQLAMLSGHAATVESAAYSPDGTHIVTASDDKTARIWDVHTGAQLAVLSGHAAAVESVAYSPDGMHIVTASDDKTARIWDVSTNRPLAVLSGHSDRVLSAAYSPDGTHIVTASDDKTARIWDARTGQQLTVLAGHGDRVASAAYSPDGARIVTASQDGITRIWDAHVPAGIEAQIMWAASAQIDPLPATERAQLGLPLQSSTRNWAATSATDRRAAGQKDAHAGEPNLLARLAAHEEKYALYESDPTLRDGALLKAFTLYASAAERANRQHWPDDAWRTWRYRRATLARLLAREGWMQQVADAYQAVLDATP